MCFVTADSDIKILANVKDSYIKIGRRGSGGILFLFFLKIVIVRELFEPRSPQEKVNFLL